MGFCRALPPLDLKKATPKNSASFSVVLRVYYQSVCTIEYIQKKHSRGDTLRLCQFTSMILLKKGARKKAQLFAVL